MSKLWLTLITQDKQDSILELVKDTYDYFNGIVAVDHYSKDNTFNILNQYRKEGKIIQLPYQYHHGWSMNGFLFSGAIKNLDWFLILDSSDRPKIEWLKNLRNDIRIWEKNGIGAVYLDRIFLAQYYDGMEFFSGIHWGIQGIRGKSISLLSNDKTRDDFVINTRMKNRDISGICHPVKYFVEFSSNSQCELLYSQFGQDILKFHINERLKFRIYCQQILNLAPTVKELEDYISKGVKEKNLPEYIIDYINFEVNLCDLVRFYILKQDLLSEIAKNRFSWNFKKFYNEGIEHQENDGSYIGQFNKYKIQKGEKPE